MSANETNDAEYELEPVPQNYQYCNDTYKLMAEEGVERTAEDGAKLVVWEGFFTHLIVERMNLSVPYYSTIRRELMRMGCIRQLRRGGGTSPSQWELIKPPTEDLYRNAPAKRTHGSGKAEALEGQVRDLGRRLSRVEENFMVLMKFIQDNGGKVPFDEPKREGAGSKQYETIEE